MKNVMGLLILVLLVSACSSEEPKPVTLCEKPCVSDTLYYTLKDHKYEPYVKLVPSNCLIDTVIWSSKLIPTKRKIHLSTSLELIPAVDKSTVRCYIVDTNYAYVIFNDCLTRRGFWLKLPLGEKGTTEQSVSALNPADPRYSVEEGLICYKANNTVYVEEILTGKKATVEVPSPKFEFNTMYEVIDSIHVTRGRLYMNLKDGSKEVPFEKTITLK